MPWDNVEDTSDFTRDKEAEKEMAECLKKLNKARCEEREQRELWRKRKMEH